MASCMSVAGGSPNAAGSTGSASTSCEPEWGLSGLGVANDSKNSSSGLSPTSAAVEDIPARLGLTEAAVQARYPNLQPGDRIVFSDSLSPLSSSPEAIGRAYGIDAETMRRHNPYHSFGDPVVVPREPDNVRLVKPTSETHVTKPQGVCEADLDRALARQERMSLGDRLLSAIGGSDPAGVGAAELFKQEYAAMPDSNRESSFIYAEKQTARPRCTAAMAGVHPTCPRKG